MIAPDSLKGTAPAPAAAAALAAGWRSVRPDDELVLLPQADGGEGTLDAIAAARPDAVMRTAEVTGPHGRPVAARWLLGPDGDAVLELAETSAITMMTPLDPLGATTRGLGELIARALDAGATSLTIGLGGSASTDGAAGALAALGLELLDAEGRPLPDGGGALTRLAALDLSRLRPTPPGGVFLLTDVDSPLLGSAGAAARFGPQKGASPEQIELLDGALGRFAAAFGGHPAAPGAGAAGGAGYGLATWGAEIVPGAPRIAALTGLPSALADADVVIFAEGRFDATSLAGKVVGHGLGLVPPGVRAVVVAGSVAAEPVLPSGRVAEAVALDRLAPSVEAAHADALRWLEAAGAEAARG